jgi:hypothetical protein
LTLKCNTGHGADSRGAHAPDRPQTRVQQAFPGARLSPAKRVADARAQKHSTQSNLRA